MKPTASVFSCADQTVNKVNCRDRFAQFHCIWAHPCVLQAHARSSFLLCSRYALFECVAHRGKGPFAPSRAGQALGSAGGLAQNGAGLFTVPVDGGASAVGWWLTLVGAQLVGHLEDDAG